MATTELSNIQSEICATLFREAINYENRADQLSDNYSNLGLVEARKIIGAPSFSEAIKRLQSSPFFAPETKVDMDSSRVFPRDAVVWLTEAGVNAWFDYQDSLKAEVNLDEVTTTGATGFIKHASSGELINITYDGDKIYTIGCSEGASVEFIKSLGFNVFIEM